MTGQTPWYAVMRTVSPFRIHSPVRSIPAPRICRARGGIQPGRMVPAQHSWSPVHLLGPGYPAPALRTVSGASAQPSPGSGRIVPALRSRSQVHLHSPVCLVPAPRTCPEARVTSPLPAPDLQCASTVQYVLCRLLHTCPEVRVISPVPPVPVPRIRSTLPEC